MAKKKKVTKKSSKKKVSKKDASKNRLNRTKSASKSARTKTSKKKAVRRTSRSPSKKKVAPALTHVPISKSTFKEKVFVRRKVTREKGILHRYTVQLVAAIISIAALIYLFRGMYANYNDIIFFSIISLTVLLLADMFFRHEHKPHDATIIGCVFFLPPLLTAVIFSRLWAWILVALMGWSLLTSVVIHFHHKKGSHLTEVMWVSTYSHLLAFTAATVVFALISYIAPTTHLTGITTIAAYLIPPIFVHFFLSHYLYVHHFDPVHTKHDLMVGLKYGLIFSVILFVALSALYMGMGAKALSETADADLSVYTLSAADSLSDSMENPGKGLEGLEVYSDVERYLLEREKDALEGKKSLDRQLGISSLVTDGYLDIILRSVKDDLVFMTDLLVVQKAKTQMDLWALKDVKDPVSREEAVLYSPDAYLPGFISVRAALYSDEISPEALADEINPVIVSLSGNDWRFRMDPLRSFIEQRLGQVVRYSRFSLFMSKAMFQNVELGHSTINNGLWNSLLEGMNKDESEQSRQLRQYLLAGAAKEQQRFLKG